MRPVTIATGAATAIYAATCVEPARSAGGNEGGGVCIIGDGEAASTDDNKAMSRATVVRRRVGGAATCGIPRVGATLSFSPFPLDGG